jgi:hypothetical protein
MSEHPPHRDHEPTDADDRDVELDEPTQEDPPVDDDRAELSEPDPEAEDAEG